MTETAKWTPPVIPRWESTLNELEQLFMQRNTRKDREIVLKRAIREVEAAVYEQCAEIIRKTAQHLSDGDNWWFYEEYFDDMVAEVETLAKEQGS